MAIGTAAVFCLCIKYPTGLNVGDMTVWPFVSLFTAAAGSYAPDIDMGTTHAGREHANVSKVISTVGGGHRGITHTLLVPIVLYVFMKLLNNYLNPYQTLLSLIVSPIFGFEVGWVMHIFADLFNGKGCPLLWPISRSKISIMDLPSSGAVPWIFAVVLIGIMGAFTFGGLFG